MSRKDELLALADRVEALTRPSADCDNAVASALDCEIDDGWDFTDESGDIVWWLEAWGFDWFKMRTTGRTMIWVEVENKQNRDTVAVSRNASSVTRALTAAALRALAATEQ